MADWTWTDAEIDAMVTAGHAAAVDQEPRAVDARYDRDSNRIVVDLANGTTFIFPAWMGQGLAGADPDLLAEVTLSPEGYGLHWAKLDADLSIAGILQGSFGGARWMAQVRSELARQAGSVTSEAKAKAARTNGQKGGRPKNAKRA
ncbi:MAG: DUF2442 domain-containing protein [Candidatus Sericytochromatia bacterium]|nr:DUF2442 domain-containing protein [Candidatus Sericytochromatia bacterium]